MQNNRTRNESPRRFVFAPHSASRILHSYLALMALIVLIFASETRSDNRPPFRDPPLPSIEEAIYEIKENGKLFLSTHTISRKNLDGQEVYTILTHDFEIVVQANNLRTISARKIDETGKVEYTCEYKYGSKRRVHFVYPGPQRNKVKEIPEDSYDENTMIEVLRGYPFDQKKPEVEFTLVSTERVVGVYAKIKGEEKFSTPLGTFDCYLIEAGVSGLKGKVNRTKYLFWIEKEYPYRMIRHKDSNDERMVTLVGYGVLPSSE
jgi:hypothetical protein